MKRSLLSITVAVAVAAPLAAHGFGPDTTLEWLEANQTAEPEFQPGDVVTHENHAVLKPFVPPAYHDIMFFKEMKVEIAETSDLTPAEAYKQATLQYQGQVRLAEDGAIENYVAGFAFDPEKLRPEAAPGGNGDGNRAIWTYNFRWQSRGLEVKTFYGAWVREGGTHDAKGLVKPEHEEIFGGGGTFPRILWGGYHRSYFNFRADLADQDYRIKGRWADGTEYRELTHFNEPFDIRGTAFLILRYTDPRRADDSWAYIPNLRRVRRISVEVKSDSLLGTDHTIEDFYGFAGRVLEHEWRYVGRARILAVARSKYTQTHYYGPNGWAIDDRWELRPVHVVEQLPTFQPDHPYKRKFIFLNADNMDCLYAEAFDRADELWKVWQLNKIWTEDSEIYPVYAEEHKGMRVPAFQSIQVIDLQNGRGTIFPVTDPDYRGRKLSYLKKILDVNYLSAGQ